jgi:hypothetical protein
MDFFDYSPAAAGMTYYNDLNTGGVVIDGVPETPVAGPIAWQMVTGAQGTVVQAVSFVTNIPAFAYTSYYLDNATNPITQCTGDGFAYGSSGAFVNPTPAQIPCTDPGLGCTNFMNTTNTLYYEAPGTSVASAQTLDSAAKTPLTHATQVWQGLPPSVGGVADAPQSLPPAAVANDGSSEVLIRLTSVAIAAILTLAGIYRMLRRR